MLHFLTTCAHLTTCATSTCSRTLHSFLNAEPDAETLGVVKTGFSIGLRYAAGMREMIRVWLVLITKLYLVWYGAWDYKKNCWAYLKTHRIELLLNCVVSDNLHHLWRDTLSIVQYRTILGMGPRTPSWNMMIMMGWQLTQLILLVRNPITKPQLAGIWGVQPSCVVRSIVSWITWISKFQSNPQTDLKLMYIHVKPP